jgi:hypothetical protein
MMFNLGNMFGNLNLEQQNMAQAMADSMNGDFGGSRVRTDKKTLEELPRFKGD